MNNPKWRFMSLAEIKADHEVNGGKTDLLTVSLCEQDVNKYFLVVENETKQKDMPHFQKRFESEEEGLAYIEELNENPKYAVIVQPT